ncbi:hypothetical protein PI86_02950 [Burkholderia sp. A9]|nr:hypothetical protein PI86_02950 [Burkholderia sp. A9]
MGVASDAHVRRRGVRDGRCAVSALRAKVLTRGAACRVNAYRSAGMRAAQTTGRCRACARSMKRRRRARASRRDALRLIRWTKAGCGKSARRRGERRHAS